MTWQDVLQFIAAIGPGFVLLKVLYIFGGQHRRLEWEWVVWSVIIGLCLSGFAGFVVMLGSSIEGPLPREAVEIGLRFVLAMAGGVGLAWLWAWVKDSDDERARRLVRYIGDSAWDFVLDEANRKDRGVEVTTEQDGKEISYYGSLDTFGQEVAEAEPWLYITFVYRWEDGKGYLPMARQTVGMLFHKTEIKRLRFIERGEPVLEEPVLTGIGTGLAAAVIINPPEPES
jgi:hypothetical protein